MFLPEETYEEINKLLILKKPLEPVDKNNLIQNLDSLYELEDYIKEKVYDKKYPGLLPEINQILLSQDENSDEDNQNSNENKNNNFNKNILNIIDNSVGILDKKYQINSKPGDIVKFDSNKFSTDDEDEFNAIELLNEERSENNENNWIFDTSKDNINVYYKINKVKIDEDNEIKVLFLYVDLIADISSSKFEKYFNDNNFRKEFDKVYSKAEIIKENLDEINNIKIIDLYLYLKMPFFLTDRDFTTRKKIWKDHNNKKGCYLMHMKSVNIEDYPEKAKPVRGNFIIRAGYISPYNDAENEEKCKFSFITCFDMKLQFPLQLIKNESIKEQRIWAEDLIKNIKKHEE